MVTNNVTAEFVIRVDRRRCPHRPAQMSASTGADVCIDRCGSKSHYYNHVFTA
ncbi:hypothetical protein [Leyella stercorea]